jgi:hypothetical protein
MNNDIELLAIIINNVLKFKISVFSKPNISKKSCKVLYFLKLSLILKAANFL